MKKDKITSALGVDLNKQGLLNGVPISQLPPSTPLKDGDEIVIMANVARWQKQQEKRKFKARFNPVIKGVGK
jgi:hypothetical protein